MEGNVFEVRYAELKDADAISKITKEAFQKYRELVGISTVAALEETREQIESDILHKIVLVAYMDEEVVGSLRIEVLPDQTAYLSRFGVSMRFQNLGIGKALMNLADVTMKAKGVTQMRLHTGAKVAGLIRFYYGRGFYVDSTTKDRGYIRALLCKDYVSA